MIVFIFAGKCKALEEFSKCIPNFEFMYSLQDFLFPPPFYWITSIPNTVLPFLKGHFEVFPDNILIPHILAAYGGEAFPLAYIATMLCMSQAQNNGYSSS